MPVLAHRQTHDALRVVRQRLHPLARRHVPHVHLLVPAAREHQVLRAAVTERHARHHTTPHALFSPSPLVRILLVPRAARTTVQRVHEQRVVVAHRRQVVLAVHLVAHRHAQHDAVVVLQDRRRVLLLGHAVVVRVHGRELGNVVDHHRALRLTRHAHTHVLARRRQHPQVLAVRQTAHLARVPHQVVQLRVTPSTRPHVVGGGVGLRVHQHALLLHRLVEARRVQRVAVDHVVLPAREDHVITLLLTTRPHAHCRHRRHRRARVERLHARRLLGVEHAHVEVRRRGHHQSLLPITRPTRPHRVRHHRVHAVRVAHELLDQHRHADVLRDVEHLRVTPDRRLHLHAVVVARHRHQRDPRVHRRAHHSVLLRLTRSRRSYHEQHARADQRVVGHHLLRLRLREALQQLVQTRLPLTPPKFDHKRQVAVHLLLARHAAQLVDVHRAVERRGHQELVVVDTEQTRHVALVRRPTPHALATVLRQVVLVLDLANQVVTLVVPRADRVVASTRKDGGPIGGDRQRAHVAQVTVHRRDQVARDALVVVLRVSGGCLDYALAQSVGTQRLRVPEVNAAVATRRRQVVQRGAEGEDAHVTLVRVDRLQEGEAGRHNSISTRTPFPRPTT